MEETQYFNATISDVVLNISEHALGGADGNNTGPDGCPNRNRLPFAQNNPTLMYIITALFVAAVPMHALGINSVGRAARERKVLIIAYVGRKDTFKNEYFRLAIWLEISDVVGSVVWLGLKLPGYLGHYASSTSIIIVWKLAPSFCKNWNSALLVVIAINRLVFAIWPAKTKKLWKRWLTNCMVCGTLLYMATLYAIVYNSVVSTAHYWIRDTNADIWNAFPCVKLKPKSSGTVAMANLLLAYGHMANGFFVLLAYSTIFYILKSQHKQLIEQAGTENPAEADINHVEISLTVQSSVLCSIMLVDSGLRVLRYVMVKNVWMSGVLELTLTAHFYVDPLIIILTTKQIRLVLHGLVIVIKEKLGCNAINTVHPVP